MKIEKIEIPIKVNIDDIKKLIKELALLQTYKIPEGNNELLVNLDAVIEVILKHVVATNDALNSIKVTKCNNNDSISRQDAIDVPDCINGVEEVLRSLPPAQPEEVIPHRNYKYLSDYWCECGWHLGKKNEVKYCSDCGRKVNWDE